jgi:hypothetical protein
MATISEQVSVSVRVAPESAAEAAASPGLITCAARGAPRVLARLPDGNTL